MWAHEAHMPTWRKSSLPFLCGGDLPGLSHTHTHHLHGHSIIHLSFTKLSAKVHTPLHTHPPLHPCSVPGVVQLLRTDETPDAVLLFFRACARGDLYRALHSGAWDEGRLRGRVVAPLLAVLADLHALGYVHRDIKWVVGSARAGGCAGGCGLRTTKAAVSH
jgi:hypothetical protein